MHLRVLAVPSAKSGRASVLPSGRFRPRMSVLTRRAGEVFGARVEQGVRMQGGRGQVADALVVFRESIEASRDVHAPIGVTSAHREPDEPRARRWLLDE